jgi:hypothetical protein
MAFGIHLPQYGRVANGEAVARAARHAEELGFTDVWVSDHVVHPAEQSYPSPYLLDPFATLAWAAAVTAGVRLGTSVLVIPQHNPRAWILASSAKSALRSKRPASSTWSRRRGRRTWTAGCARWTCSRTLSDRPDPPHRGYSP